MLRTVSKSLIITSLLAVAASGDTQAKDVSRQKDAAETTKNLTPAPIDPAAIKALNKMGAYLREQKSFSVRTKMETDYVIESGQKITQSSTGDLLVRRPDHLRANVVSENKNRQFFYDGDKFTMYSPIVGYYATVDAPSTILQTSDVLELKYGIQLPLVDLFRFGTARGGTDEIQAATYVGPTRVDGIDVDHYAFRQPGLDWQIWIQRGNQPLPRKMLLTATDDEARPEYTVDLAWDLGAKFDDSVFAFAPPKDSKKIAVVDITTQAADQPRSARRRPPQNPQR